MRRKLDKREIVDVLVLGTGIGGLSTALGFAQRGASVLVLTKTSAMDGATRWAQGGIASVFSAEDSFEEHKQDTLKAGAGLCDPAIVDLCVREGPARVRELIELGVPFTKSSEQTDGAGGPAAQAAYDLHREGGHTKRRILHTDDMTGLAIESTLLSRIRENSNIRLFENAVAIDLVTEGKLGRSHLPGRCLGAYVLDAGAKEIIVCYARVVILATGGAGKVFLYTSNPDVATGDGVAMAHRAGAQISNMEFFQFHPTCLYHPAQRTFLITEALRGEGAQLRTFEGEALESMAPRDQTALAIDRAIKRTGAKHAWLDATHLSRPDWESRFPGVYKVCREAGIDPVTQKIPVVPAAHYMCGGVKTDAWGQTSIAGLYAVGEVACTGLHGANRLASNSLLEAVVFAHRAVEHASSELGKASGKNGATNGKIPEWDKGLAVEIEEQADLAAAWVEIRQLMWNYVGIVRSDSRLERAHRRLELLRTEVMQVYWDHVLTRDLVELRNLVTVAELIVGAATLRKESRGLHFNKDYPSGRE